MTDPAVLQAILRTDLVSFIGKTVQTVSPADCFLDNWHIHAIAWELQRVQDGKCPRLLITQPPRSLKSICVSVAFVAWALGHNPRLRFICVSYSQDLAEALARQFRLVVESSWYRALFPAMCIARSTAAELITTAGGGRLATSTGGTLTGRGADIIIIDDPMKASDAPSAIARQSVLSWYRETLITRLNNKRTGAIVTVMQRLHEDDLAGYLVEQGEIEHLDLPAIAIEDQKVVIGKNRVYHRRAGDLLHPEREPQEALDRIMAELGSLAFSAQYQQRPVPLEGNLVRRIWFGTYDALPSGDRVRITQSWDIAGSLGDGRDYSVCLTFYSKGKFHYLADVWRGRLEFPKLKRKVIGLQQRFGARSVQIEAVGLGLSLCQELSQDSPDGFPNPIRVKPKDDKLTRMEAQTPLIEAGQVLLPREAPWLDGFLHELLAFPNGRHDDQVDALSQFLARRSSFNELPPLGIGGGKQVNPFADFAPRW